MVFLAPFHAWFRVRGPRPGNARHFIARPRYRDRVPLILESLEDRSLPSTFTVTDLGDAGLGSGLQGDLRYAIATANANLDLSNHIIFEPGLTGTIILNRGPLAITKNLEIDGPGQELLTVSGNHQSGVFHITGDARVQDVRLADLTVADGTGIRFPLRRFGGGIYDDHAALTLTRVTVAGNSLPDQGNGGGIYTQSGALTLEACTHHKQPHRIPPQGSVIQGSAIFSLGDVVIHDSIISGNSGDGLAPAPAISARFFNGTLVLSHSVVSNNVGRGILSSSAMIDHATISGNTGGGIWADGGLAITDSTIADNTGGLGILTQANRDLTATIQDSTISGNNAGGIQLTGGPANHLEVTNSTISGNTAQTGGGIIMGFQDIMVLTNCTITGNSATGTPGSRDNRGGRHCAFRLPGDDWDAPHAQHHRGWQLLRQRRPDVKGPVMSQGYNLIGQRDGSQGWLPSDLTGTSADPLDPLLGPLQDNGGLTLTHAPLLGSPALGAGDPSLDGTPDQRGSLRSGLSPAIGAVAAREAVAFQVIAPASVALGQPFSFTVIAVDAWGNTASTYSGTIHFSSTDLAAQLPDDYTFEPSEGGAHTFVAAFETRGLQTLRFYDVEQEALLYDLTYFVE